MIPEFQAAYDEYRLGSRTNLTIKEIAQEIEKTIKKRMLRAIGIGDREIYFSENQLLKEYKITSTQMPKVVKELESRLDGSIKIVGEHTGDDRQWTITWIPEQNQ